MENSKPSTSHEFSNMEEDTSSMNNELMNNTKYIPSSSKSEITDVKVCKSCDKSFDECKILKHITHASCGEKYTKEEINMLRKLAKERSTRKKLEHFTQITNFANQSELIAANIDIHQQGDGGAVQPACQAERWNFRLHREVRLLGGRRPTPSRYTRMRLQ